VNIGAGQVPTPSQLPSRPTISGFLGEQLQAVIERVAEADALIAVTPVYKAGIERTVQVLLRCARQPPARRQAGAPRRNRGQFSARNGVAIGTPLDDAYPAIASVLVKCAIAEPMNNARTTRGPREGRHPLLPPTPGGTTMRNRKV
jgi:hypothetical protein